MPCAAGRPADSVRLGLGEPSAGAADLLSLEDGLQQRLRLRRRCDAVFAREASRKVVVGANGGGAIADAVAEREESLERRLVIAHERRRTPCPHEATGRI